MNFYEYLIKKYGYNEPILLNEIKFGNYSKPWINKQLANLCAEEKLIRFEQGVYYVPKMTALGASKLNPVKVIEKKYIRDKNGQKGYYSGATFLNIIGLSTQVSNVFEIYTNEETSKVREISVGSAKVVLRKARTLINDANVMVQSFLELMNYINASFLDDERKEILAQFIKTAGITRADITKYASAFPDKAIRTLLYNEYRY